MTLMNWWSKKKRWDTNIEIEEKLNVLKQLQRSDDPSNVATVK